METITAEKVLFSELDGGGDGDILTNGIEADAAGIVAVNLALSELHELAILVLVATV